MEQDPKNVETCSQCGNIVTTHKTIGGTLFFIPVSNEYLDSILRVRSVDVDLILHDRLRRAERIIVELRKEVTELRSK